MHRSTVVVSRCRVVLPREDLSSSRDVSCIHSRLFRFGWFCFHQYTCRCNIYLSCKNLNDGPDRTCDDDGRWHPPILSHVCTPETPSLTLQPTLAPLETPSSTLQPTPAPLETPSPNGENPLHRESVLPLFPAFIFATENPSLSTPSVKFEHVCAVRLPSMLGAQEKLPLSERCA